MKNPVLLILFLLTATAIQAQILVIPDTAFKNTLLRNPAINTDGDDEITVQEAAVVTRLDVSRKGITDLFGIRSFVNLDTLICSHNSLSHLDIRGLSNLTYLDCSYNNLRDERLLLGGIVPWLNISAFSVLEYLNISDNEMEVIDLRALSLHSLKEVHAHDNGNLRALYARGTSNLEVLQMSFCRRLITLDVRGLSNLRILNFHGGALRGINLEGLHNLRELYCGNNNLTNLNISALVNLKKVSCSGNSLTSLNVRRLRNLEELQCSNNSLTSLNVSGLRNLRELNCENNSLTSLNVSGLTNLILLNCQNNSLTNLNVNGLRNLSGLNCMNNNVIWLDIRNTTHSSLYLNARNNNLRCILGRRPYSYDIDPGVYFSDQPCLISWQELRSANPYGYYTSGYNFAYIRTLDHIDDAEQYCQEGNRTLTIASLNSALFWSREGSEMHDALIKMIFQIENGYTDCGSTWYTGIIPWFPFFFLEDNPDDSNGTLSPVMDIKKEVIRVVPSKSRTLTVYPNPTDGRLNLSASVSEALVFSSLGRLISRVEHTDHLDLSGFLPGVYVIHTRDGEEWTSHRVVKK